MALRLSIEDPVGMVDSASLDAKWVRNSSTGDFKSSVNKTGNLKRDFYPLFRLVSLTEGDASTGLRGDLNEDLPPWEPIEPRSGSTSDG